MSDEVFSKVSGLVIAYNPTQTQIDLMVENSKQFRTLYVWCNSEIESLPESANITISGGFFNEGIAYAINQTVTSCTDKYLILLDQDSMIEDSFSVRMVEFMEKNPYLSMSGPVIKEYGSEEILNGSDPTRIITSGSIMRLDLCRDIKFDEKLFIDYVDFDYCLRLLMLGHRLEINKEVCMFQALGNPIRLSFLGIVISSSNHSALRRYYMFRNRIYIIRRHFIGYPFWCGREIIRSVTEIAKIILAEDDKIQKIKYIWMGTKDALSGNMGKRF